MNKLRVFYIWDENLIQQCDRLPVVPDRASLVHHLITAYGLTNHLQLVRSTQATYNELKEFHSELYLDHLKTFTEVDEEEYESNTQDEKYGIAYDCPPVSSMFELVSTLAGGSITAAKSLVLDLADVAINWCGGWHHAERSCANGFCYVNDIVLAIEKLRLKFPKVLYVDLDVHHGNGVQDAYNLSKSVFTLSFHKFEPGFYPGTGDIQDIGTLTGKGHSCNVPLHASYTDETLLYVFDKVFEKVHTLFDPAAIVVQCGADALAHDPHGGSSLTTKGYCSCVQKMLDKKKPTILLGGGGYKNPNAARLWTSLTALVVGVELDENIPEHEFWTSYGPNYTLAVEPTLARDTNKKSYLDNCISTIIANLETYLDKEYVEDEKNSSDAKKRKTDDQCTDITTLKSEKPNCDMRNINSQDSPDKLQNQNCVEDKNNEIDVYVFTED